MDNLDQYIFSYTRYHAFCVYTNESLVFFPHNQDEYSATFQALFLSTSSLIDSTVFHPALALVNSQLNPLTLALHLNLTLALNLSSLSLALA